MGYSYDFYKNTCERLKKSGFEPKRILDIGASMGFTAEIAKSCWPNAELTLFEGNGECRRYLENYNCIYKLLGKETGIVNFYKSKLDQFGTGNSIYKENSDYYKDQYLIIEPTPIYKLDDCVSGVFEFIKIDTQGSELDIIKGGTNIIGKSKVVVVESSLTNTNEGGCTKQQLIDVLVNYLKFDFVDIIEYIYDDSNVILHQNLLFIRK